MKITRENIERHLLEYQLSLVGKTMMDTLDDDQWYFNITITREKFTEFEKYAIKLIKKVFKCNTSRAKKTFDWFNLNLGLRIKD